jgi:fructose-1,6-bisphosphatase/inositol monophosphatase family enzyme
LIGEEASEKDPSLLHDFAGLDLAFIVDPIDGTLNYAAGVPLFGVMIAAVVKGEVVAGIIHDPMGGGTFMALRGEGAWSLAPGGARTDLRVAKPDALARMRGAVSWHLMAEPLRSSVAARIPRVALGLCYHCAAHEYRLVTAGHVHFLLYGTLKPWDHAPGWLMHREAGGYAAHFDGSPYLPSHLTGGLLCAPDRDTWALLQEALLTDGASGTTSFP